MKDSKYIKEEYEHYVSQEDLSIFYRPWYLDAVCSPDHWHVALVKQDQKVVAVWPYYLKKKYGLSTITQPLFTPHLGPHLSSIKEKTKKVTQISWQKKILTDLANQIPNVSRLVVHGHPLWQYWQPLSWMGYQQTTRYTYHLQLNDKEDHLYQGLSGKVRNQIRASTKDVIIETIDEAKKIFYIVKSTYERQGYPSPYTLDQFQKIHETLQSRNAQSAFVANNKGSHVAVTYNIIDHNVSYLLMTGRSNNAATGAVSALIWRSIKEAKSRGCVTYDFEGSMIEGVESFFRSFGGCPVPYHRITKTANQALFHIFKMLGKL